MTRMQPTRGSNLSDDLSCPHCNTQLPSRAVFCSSCGERVKQPNEELETHANLSSDEAGEQEAKTIRLEGLPQLYLKRWLSYQSRKNHNHSDRSQESSPSLQGGEEVSTRSILSVQEVGSANATALHEAPIQIEPAQSSPTTSAPSISMTSEQASIHSNLLWSIIIILSAVAAGLVNFVLPHIVLRPIIVFWFLFICPGMVVVRFLRLKEPVIEWTLAVALSFAIEALVAAIQVYSGRWDPAATLAILIGFCFIGSAIQLARMIPITSIKVYPIVKAMKRPTEKIASSHSPRTPNISETVKSRFTRPLQETVQVRRFQKYRMLFLTLFALLVMLLGSIGVGTSQWHYIVYNGSPSTTSTSALPHKTTPHPSPTSTGVPTPSTSTAHIAALYSGTIYDLSANISTQMSLTGIQQTQVTIGGNFTGLHRTGAFNGTIDPHPPEHIQFTVKGSAGHPILSFDGHLQSDGELSGSYCSIGQNAQCTGEYGLWSVTPAS